MSDRTSDTGAPSGLFRSLEPLFRPLSVAIVGASATPYKQGNTALKYLLQGGYAGKIYPVNPSGGEIEGMRAYESLSAINAPVDCALFVIPAGAVLPAMEECAAVGVKSVIIGANGFAELGTSEGLERQRELTRIATAHGIRVVGPNTNGIWNATDRLSLGYNASHGDPMTPGPVSIAAHSGALFNSIAPSLRRFGAGLSKFVPVGNEADLDVLDFLEYFIEDPDTGVIGLIIEAVRDGERLGLLAERAHGAGKPVIALKLGRSAAGAGAALAHSSRLAGNARAYDALFREAGILQARSIEAMAGACALLVGRRRAPSPDRRGLVCVTTSGGGGGLLADYASAFDIPLAGHVDGSWGGGTADLIASFEGAGPIFNPIDGGNLAGWGRLEQIFTSLEAEGWTGPVLFFAHMLPRAEADAFVQQMLARRGERTGSLVVCIAPGGLREDIEKAYRSDRIPVFHDIGTCFEALRCAYDAMEFQPGAIMAGERGWSSAHLAAVAAELDRAPAIGLLNELQSAAILKAAGVSIVESSVAADVEEAVRMAGRIGYPVVVKGLAPNVAHKNDAGLVAVDLAGEAQVRSAYREIVARMERLAPEGPAAPVIIQPCIRSKLELIIGVSREPPLGHFLVVGLGGVHAELLDEALLFPAHATESAIRERLAAGKIGALLLKLSGGQDGGSRLLDELMNNLLALQQFSKHFSHRIHSIDINPVLVVADGCVGVDALLELRQS